MTQGQVGILNVGAGDTKLSFDKSNPIERERAKKIIQDMIKRGYSILVQVGGTDLEPLMRRAHDFDPETCEYIIMGGPDEVIDIGVEDGKSSKAEKAAPAGDGDRVYGGAEKPRSGRQRSIRIPAESTRAVAVGRTSGG